MPVFILERLSDGVIQEAMDIVRSDGVANKQYFCKCCDKQWKSKSGAKSHLNSKKITGEPYKVPVRKPRLDENGNELPKVINKPYVCDVCDKGFKCQYDLDKHSKAKKGPCWSRKQVQIAADLQGIVINKINHNDVGVQNEHNDVGVQNEHNDVGVPKKRARKPRAKKIRIPTPVQTSDEE